MKKGRLISIAGRIETRSYEAQDGNRRYVTEVVAEDQQFLDWGDKSQGQAPQGIPSDYFGGGDMTQIDDGEDMPF